MSQAALNDVMDLPKDTWVLVSEINCTFVNVGVIPVEIIGATGSPADGVRGIPYLDGQGEEALTDTLSRFPGSGGATGIYAISRGYKGRLFVSRGAVA